MQIVEYAPNEGDLSRLVDSDQNIQLQFANFLCEIDKDFAELVNKAQYMTKKLPFFKSAELEFFI